MKKKIPDDYFENQEFVVDELDEEVEKQRSHG